MSTSKYFEIRELVSPDIYNLIGDNAGKLLDPELIETLDIIREILDVPIICNNGHTGGSRKNCGLRAVNCSTGAKKSLHKEGRAADIISPKMSAAEMRDKIEVFQHLLKYPIRIEKGDKNGEINGVHIDMGNTMNNKILGFKA